MTTHLFSEKIEMARALTRNVLAEALKFRLSVDINTYVTDRAVTEPAGLEGELSAAYAIRGVGIRANRDNSRSPNDFINKDSPLDPEDAVAEMQNFPFHAASCAYLFTVLEIYGNDLALCVVGAPPARGDWHSSASERLKFSVVADVTNAKTRIAGVFGRTKEEIDDHFLASICELKKTRNAIIHEAHRRPNFEDFFETVLSMICQVHFLALPGDQEIIIYPWPDFNNEYLPTPNTEGVYRRVKS
ncbi:hypothetical protein [Rhizobium laguerreae]|uniref:hypothetical protein n=1 Tax=Rhizobium laguerreae TaxID=1076926 RepID=UPI001C929F57|nr:hypothetical protein [Rhizobium laguerreae]MBY3364970.1 hypothetical protein [Rhizobium laguerreae]MBY3384174.1 hypothetical protein [Rhizobium laguerreae]MBY3397835.1 hypothetical protein [Rhizobium laguerreae]MBY3404775.1 hypothetical protein [Rhizobium laguerreae]